METGLFTSVKEIIKNWWISLVLGIVFVIMGVWMICDPVESLITLSLVFSLLWLFSGIMEIIFAVSNRKSLEAWGWTLTSGIIDFLLGAFLFIFPWVTLAILPFLVAFWFMFKGILAIGFSLDLHRMKTAGWGYLLTLGIVISILSLIFIFIPMAGLFTVVTITSFTFLLMGIYRIMLSFELKKFKKDLDL